MVRRAEGQAILSRWPLSDAFSKAIARRWTWSWRRRIVVAAMVRCGGHDFQVLCAHLAGDAREEVRVQQATRTVSLTSAASAVVVVLRLKPAGYPSVT